MLFDSTLFSLNLSRREWLRLSNAAALGGTLALSGCGGGAMTGGTFLQAWNDQLDWTRRRWSSELKGMIELGCTTLFLQWVGLEGESSEQWSRRGRMLQLLMEEAAKQGVSVHLGLPYNQNWWSAIHQADDRLVAGYLQMIGTNCVNYMSSVTWQRLPAFAGWYIPYEVEQYHWGQTQPRLEMLAGWLRSLSEVAFQTSGRAPTISTYCSEMASPDSLASMWAYLLDYVSVHPMIQDGVGVLGLDNYARLEPLRQMLMRRGARFDLVVELFERKPGTANLVGEFQAQTASIERLRAQWDVARNYGAERIIAFALEPWASQDTAEGRTLRSAWKLGLSRAQATTGPLP